MVRQGEVLLPVELRVELADGRIVTETWDGRDRWVRFRYEGAKVVRAVVDPRHKIAIDVDPSNNEWISDDRPRAPGRHQVGRALSLLAPEPPGAAHGGGVSPC